MGSPGHEGGRSSYTHDNRNIKHPYRNIIAFAWNAYGVVFHVDVSVFVHCGMQYKHDSAFKQK